jgi:hypothetical protein
MANSFGMSMPVVADPDYGVLERYTYGHPNRILLGPGAEILQIGGTVGATEIEAALPASWP